MEIGLGLQETYAKLCHGLNCVPLPNSYIKLPKLVTQNITTFWDKFFKKMVQFKWGLQGGALIQHGWCP